MHFPLTGEPRQVLIDGEWRVGRGEAPIEVLDPSTNAVLKCWTVVLTLIGIKAFVQVLRVPASLLLPAVAVLAVVGAYAIRNSVFDCFVMLGFGLLGLLFTQWAVPLMPVVLALVLGPPLEEHLRTALVISGGDPSTFGGRSARCSWRSPRR